VPRSPRPESTAPTAEPLETSPSGVHEAWELGRLMIERGMPKMVVRVNSELDKVRGNAHRDGANPLSAFLRACEPIGNASRDGGPLSRRERDLINWAGPSGVHRKAAENT
jgi:hypothetical protein